MVQLTLWSHAAKSSVLCSLRVEICFKTTRNHILSIRPELSRSMTSSVATKRESEIRQPASSNWIAMNWMVCGHQASSVGVGTE